MEYLQWLAMPAVATVAVIVTVYLGIQNLRNVIMQRERDDGYARGRAETKLENLEQLVRGVNENLRVVTEDVRVVNEKLDAHDVLLRQLRREAKKQNRRLRKLRKRVEALESIAPVPPMDPTLGGAPMEPSAVIARSPKLVEMSGRGPAVGHSGGAV